LADELRTNFGVEAELIEGRGGVFEVVADGKTIFSKKNTGRFPDENEVSELLRGT
jgi:selenoprotein W-related protein